MLLRSDGFAGTDPASWRAGPYTLLDCSVQMECTGVPFRLQGHLVYKLGYLFAYDPYDRKWDDLNKKYDKCLPCLTTLLTTEVTTTAYDYPYDSAYD